MHNNMVSYGNSNVKFKEIEIFQKMDKGEIFFIQLNQKKIILKKEHLNNNTGENLNNDFINERNRIREYIRNLPLC